jgi:nucleotide-binding universal stress UspA family protein
MNMYKKILLALALDQGHGSRAIEIARRLRAEDGKIIAVHVLDKIPSFTSYYMSADNKKLPADVEKEIQDAAKNKIADRIGTEKDADVVVLSGHPGRTITDYARKISADCIIVGSHKPGISDFFLGSTAARIMRYAPCSVHVLR